MNSSPHRKLKIIGTLLILALPICFFAAGAYSYYQPRLFSATTGFQLLYPDADRPQLQAAFQKAQQEYSVRAQERLASRVSLDQSTTPNAFSITAIDADPLTTAHTANTMTILVTHTLQDAAKEEGRRVTILQKAEMPRAPSFPNVQRIMTVGISLGSFFSIIGVVLLIVGFSNRTSS